MVNFFSTSYPTKLIRGIPVLVRKRAAFSSLNPLPLVSFTLPEVKLACDGLRPSAKPSWRDWGEVMSGSEQSVRPQGAETVSGRVSLAKKRYFYFAFS